MFTIVMNCYDYDRFIGRKSFSTESPAELGEFFEKNRKRDRPKRKQKRQK